MPVSLYKMTYFSVNFAVPSKVQCRQSALHCDVLVVGIKPVGSETAVGPCLLTTVCLKELASCQMWGADGYKFAIRYIVTDVSVRSVTWSTLMHLKMEHREEGCSSICRSSVIQQATQLVTQCCCSTSVSTMQSAYDVCPAGRCGKNCGVCCLY